MSTKPPFDHNDIEPLAWLVNGTQALCTAYDQSPPPVKVLVWTTALAVAAPVLRRAADSLGVKPAELLQVLLPLAKRA